MINQITNKGRYIRLFEFGQIPITVVEAFLIGYEDDEVYVMWDSEWFRSFMTSDTVEKTKNIGKELFATREGFLKLKEDFLTFRKRVEVEVEDIAKQEIIDVKSYGIFFDGWAETYHYYRKMEFFYIDAIFDNPNMSEEIKMLGEDLGAFKFEARKTLNDFSFEGKKWGPRIFEKISKQTGISVENLEFMERKEIESIIEGKQFDISLIEARKTAYFGTNKNQISNMLYGNQALEMMSEFKELSESSELKGVIANKGHVTGTARVMIFDMSKLSKISDLINNMNVGDILITETTSPEWMPACQKAAAIVTAQGGLLSHAAIVSRELGIPCIVGVSNVMRIIKDGDLIEVDADKGTVRILS